MSHTGDGGPATGTILIDGRFEQLSPVRKLGMLPWARLAGVILASLLLAMLVGSLRAMPRRWRWIGEDRRRPEPCPAGPRGLRELREDLVRGGGAVFMVLLAMANLPPRRAEAAGGRLDRPGSGGRGRGHRGVVEVRADRQASDRRARRSRMCWPPACSAASASPMAILQPPGSWSELLLLSQTVAAVAALLYHAANAYRLASSGRHLDGEAAALIVGTPYVVGGLVLAGIGRACCESWATASRPGLVATSPAVVEFVGRVLVLFCFNEAVANGLGLATGAGCSGLPVAHLALLAVAVAAVAGPWIAALGSGAAVASWPVAPRLVATVLTTMLSQAGLWAEVYLVTGMVMDAIHGQAPIRESVLGHPVQGMKKGMVYSGMFMGILYGLGALWDVPGSSAGWPTTLPVLAAALLGALAFPLLKTIIETFDGSPPFFRRARQELSRPGPLPRGRRGRAGPGLRADPAGCPARDLPARAWFGFGVGALAYAGVDLLRDLLDAARGRGPAPVLRVSTSCTRSWAASSARPSGSTSTVAGRRGRRQVPSLPRRRASRPSSSTSIRSSASGATSTWGRSPAA